MYEYHLLQHYQMYMMYTQARSPLYIMHVSILISRWQMILKCVLKTLFSPFLHTRFINFTLGIISWMTKGLNVRLGAHTSLIKSIYPFFNTFVFRTVFYRRSYLIRCYCMSPRHLSYIYEETIQVINVVDL
jgi:hypothetical protein